MSFTVYEARAAFSFLRSIYALHVGAIHNSSKIPCLAKAVEAPLPEVFSGGMS
jgi:hypothetical protein